MSVTARKLERNEWLTSDKISSVAFQYGIDLQKREEEYQKEDKLPANRHELFNGNRYGAFDADGTMISTMKVIKYPIRYDGEIVEMAGIGDVSSRPEYRRSGGIKEIFRLVFKDAFEQGSMFSSLYPFNIRYYRQYGYEPALEKIAYTIPMKNLLGIPFEGTMDMVEPDGDISDVRMVYDAYSENMDFMCAREDIDWKGWQKDKVSPYSDNKFVFVYKTPDGIPAGYVAYKLAKCEGNSILDSSEFMFSDMTAAKNMLGFIGRSFSANYDEVRLSLPKHIPFTLLVCENGVGRELEYTGMHRVIKVEDVLKKTRYSGSGEINIKIFDDYIPQNAGVWHVLVEDGRAKNVIKLDCAYDVAMNIGLFTRFIVGTNDYRDLIMSQLADIKCDREKLRMAFHRKSSGLYEGF